MLNRASVTRYTISRLFWSTMKHRLKRHMYVYRLKLRLFCWFWSLLSHKRLQFPNVDGKHWEKDFKDNIRPSRGGKRNKTLDFVTERKRIYYSNQPNFGLLRGNVVWSIVVVYSSRDSCSLNVMRFVVIDIAKIKTHQLTTSPIVKTATRWYKLVVQQIILYNLLVPKKRKKR